MYNVVEIGWIENGEIPDRFVAAIRATSEAQERKTRPRIGS